MSNNYEVNTKLELFDYLVMVREIVREFIDDEDGSYQPHIGKLNAMRLFYNHCVIKSKFDEKYGHNVVKADVMKEIVADEAFMKAFNHAIECDASVRYDFANAYRDALDIVNVKKSSFGSAVNTVSSTINKLFEKVVPMLTDENVKAISKIAKDLSNNKLTADAVVDAYAKSKRFQEVINNTQKSEMSAES